MTYISYFEGVFRTEKYPGILSITAFNIPTFHVLRIPFDVPKYVFLSFIQLIVKHGIF